MPHFGLLSCEGWSFLAVIGYSRVVADFVLCGSGHGPCFSTSGYTIDDICDKAIDDDHELEFRWELMTKASRKWEGH